jgi:DNA-binding XRE family transcriptional regulator
VVGVRVDTVEECGARQTRTTVTYRFSQPDQPMAMVLPQSYSTGRVIRIPVKPQTVGDHIRKRRLSLKLFQKDVAEQLGVDSTSIPNWEANRSVPEIPYMPAIIRFLGYDPLPPANTLAQQLVRKRTSLGLFAGGIRQASWCGPQHAVEMGTPEREPAGAFLMRVKRFLSRDGQANRFVDSPRLFL